MKDEASRDERTQQSLQDVIGGDAGRTARRGSPVEALLGEIRGDDTVIGLWICTLLCLNRMVLAEGELALRRREYEFRRQAAAHSLDRSRGQLAYLSTLVTERCGGPGPL